MRHGHYNTKGKTDAEQCLTAAGRQQAIVLGTLTSYTRIHARSSYTPSFSRLRAARFSFPYLLSQPRSPEARGHVQAEQGHQERDDESSGDLQHCDDKAPRGHAHSSNGSSEGRSTLPAYAAL